MNQQDQSLIETTVSKKTSDIAEIDLAYVNQLAGVREATNRLKSALDQMSQCLDLKQFEKASQLGYQEIGQEFIFLQRCLGGLNDVISQHQKLTQDVCAELTTQISSLSYEDVAPFVEDKLKCLKIKKTN